MNKKTGFNVLGNFIYLLVFLAVIFVVDAAYISRVPKNITKLDRMRDLTNDIITSVVKLEYSLDIYIIAGSIEAGKIQIIKDDMKYIEGLLPEFVSEDNLAAITSQEGLSLVSAIKDKWSDVDKQIAAFGKAKSEEELLFIHNYVDQTTYAMNEDMKKLKGVLDSEWVMALKLKRDYDIAVIISSFVVFIAVGVFFMIRNIMPVREFVGFARDAMKGADVDFKFVESMPGELGDIYRGMAAMSNKLNDANYERDNALRDLSVEKESSLSRIVALDEISTAAARTLSHHEAFMVAIQRTCPTIGAFAGAIYLEDDSGLRLAVSKGFSPSFFLKAETLGMNEAVVASVFKSEYSVQVLNVDDYPKGDLKKVFADENVKMLLVSPIVLDNEQAGIIFFVFSEVKELTERNREFVRVVAANVASSYSHSLLFNKEYSTRSFFERVVEQMSYGIGVFTPNGLCVLANSRFKINLQGHAQSEFVNVYNVYEDEKFAKGGFVPRIKQAFDGGGCEFILENAVGSVPSVAKLPAKVFVTVLPLFTPAGNVGHVMIKTEAIKTGA